MSKKAILINDHFQNFKRYNIPKAQLVIADIPYNIGINAFASNPSWYIDGDNKNGESKLAGKEFFDSFEKEKKYEVHVPGEDPFVLNESFLIDCVPVDGIVPIVLRGVVQ